MVSAREVIDNPREFISRLKIVTKQGKVRYFHPMWEETSIFLDALLGPKRYVLALKPRQVAFTTCTTAYEFWKGYTSSGPHRCIQVVHEREVLARLMEMVGVFHDTLPPPMQRGLEHHNETRTRYAHNKSGFNRVLAGGRSQARSWSFTDAHFTEPAFYPQSTASAGRDDAGSTAEAMWQSTLATLDLTNPATKVIVESTGNGPRGLYYKLAKLARANPEWAYVFIAWSMVQRYRKPLTRDEAAAFMETLSPEEEALATGPHQLHAEQLAWRREKMEVEQWSPGRFQREYPLTDMEPFLASASGWFDQERLNAALEWCRHPLAREAVEYREFHEPEEGRRYFMGVDTAGGVGRDYAAIKVFRDDLLHVCTWMSNTAHPRRIAAMVARIGDRYTTDVLPLCLVEANNHGVGVLTRLRQMGDGKGVRLWQSPEGTDFWSSGNTTTDTKREAFTFARELLDDGRVIIECAFTILQLQGIVERWNGKIEGERDDSAELDAHDDLACAAVLALYAAKQHVKPKSVDSLERERARIAAQVRERYEAQNAQAARDPYGRDYVASR